MTNRNEASRKLRIQCQEDGATLKLVAAGDQRSLYKGCSSEPSDVGAFPFPSLQIYCRTSRSWSLAELFLPREPFSSIPAYLRAKEV